MNRRSFLHAAVVMSLSRFTDEYGRSADGAERPFPLTDAEIRIRGRAGSRCGQGMPRPPKASSELPTNRQLSAFMISESSYLLDATNPNRLWFHQFRERNWLSLNGLLRQSIEQFAA